MCNSVAFVNLFYSDSVVKWNKITHDKYFLTYSILLLILFQLQILPSTLAWKLMELFQKSAKNWCQQFILKLSLTHRTYINNIKKGVVGWGRITVGASSKQATTGINSYLLDSMVRLLIKNWLKIILGEKLLIGIRSVNMQKDVHRTKTCTCAYAWVFENCRYFNDQFFD